MLAPFAPDDARRLAASLRKLRRAILLDTFAVCGGIAAQLHLARHGLSRPDRSARDLDIVAADLRALAAEPLDGWLLSHLHRPHAGYSRWFIQLVDPDTRLLVDLFHASHWPPHDIAPHPIGDVTVSVLGARAVLADKRRLLAAATRDRPIDPKHLADARLLARLLHEPDADVPAGHLRPDTYTTDLTLRCPRCHASGSVAALAPKAMIFELLGYV